MMWKKELLDKSFPVDDLCDDDVDDDIDDLLIRKMLEIDKRATGNGKLKPSQKNAIS